MDHCSIRTFTQQLELRCGLHSVGERAYLCVCVCVCVCTQMPMAASMSYRWLEDAVTEWQTSQGQLVHTGSLAGYTPKQVHTHTHTQHITLLCSEPPGQEHRHG